MSYEELDRVGVIERVIEKRLTQREAARMLSLTSRQVRRLRRTYERKGPGGLVSKHRGRPSNRRLPCALRREALATVRSQYEGFGPTLAHEKLTERHGLRLSVETLRHWMIEDGLWVPKAHREPRIQQPRRRRPCRGELIQIGLVIMGGYRTSRDSLELLSASTPPGRVPGCDGLHHLGGLPLCGRRSDLGDFAETLRTVEPRLVESDPLFDALEMPAGPTPESVARHFNSTLARVGSYRKKDAPSVSSHRIAALAAAWVLCATAGSQAAPVTVPAGLSPGDQYRLAFVTPSMRDAMSSDIADYNAFVTAEALTAPELAALGTTWTAIVSTSAVDARDNTDTNPSSTGVPIYRLDGALVATGNADLWDGFIEVPLAIEVSCTFCGNLVWTGTNVFGQGSKVFFVAGFTSAAVGAATCSGTCWIDLGTTGYNGLLSFYAISGTLTVVPEPTTGALLALGLIALGVARRRAQRA